MKKALSLLIFSSSVAWAQTVPKEMDFGGMRLTLTGSARRQIQKDVDRLTASPTYYGILVDRMNLYFPIIERAFAEHNVPDEIKFLAIQESALISDAVSSSNAVGFWQFKDFTAREVGMRVDRALDERLNIVGASYGAAKYLHLNNAYYDNWIYAVIAYNTGRGGAERYIDKAKFGAKKMSIDNSTHWYVKKFIAHVIAFRPSVGKPHSKNIWLYEEKNTKRKSLEQIAKKHGASIEEIKNYNKWLKRGTVPTNKNYAVLIPKTGSPPRHRIAKNNKTRKKIHDPKSKVYHEPIVHGKTNSTRNGIPSILAREGDNVHTLSANAGLSEKKFRKFNDMNPAQSIVPNEFYYIKKKKRKSKIGIHVAKEGESLWNVAQQYGIKRNHLAKKNRMSIIDELKPGRVLWLKKTRPSNEPIAYRQTKENPEQTVPVASTRVTYDDPDQTVVPIVDGSEELRKVKIHTVAPGESLWRIARKYEIHIDDLLRWNQLPNPNAINIGQNIQVKPPIEEAIINKIIATHKVRPSETLYAISRKYNMTVDELMELNELKTTTIAIGQELKVYGQ